MQVSVKKLTILTFLVAFSLGFLLPDAKANDSACEELKSTPEILECLNTYGRRAVDSNSKAQEEFEKILVEDILYNYPNIDPDRLGIEPIIDQFTNPYRPYPIHFLSEERAFARPGLSDATCFHFESFNDKDLRLVIRSLKAQADEIAKFLVQYHARSLGGHSSFLFPFHGVRVCDTKVYGGDDRHLMFSEGNLLVGFRFQKGRTTNWSGRLSRASIITAEHILEQWTNGDMWRRTLKRNFLFQKMVDISSALSLGLLWDYQEWRDKWALGWKKDALAPVLDRLADYWMILDPISETRSMLLKRLANRMHSIESHSSDHYGTMAREANVQGFPVLEKDYLQSLEANPVAVDEIYQLWKKQMFSPKTIIHAFESSISHSNAGAKLELIARQTDDVFVSTSNAKVFDIRAFMNQAGPNIQNFQHGQGLSDSRIEATFVQEHFEYDDAGNQRPTSRQRLEVTQEGSTEVFTNLHQGRDTTVLTDLVDQFDIDVALNINPEQIAAYALYRAIVEHRRAAR